MSNLPAATVTGAVTPHPKFLHIRFATEESPLSAPQISAQGGITVAYEVDDKNKIARAAISICSRNDNFCYQTAQAKAAGRLTSITSRREKSRVNRGGSDQERHPEYFATWDLHEELSVDMSTEARQLIIRYVEDLRQFKDWTLISISLSGTKKHQWVLLKE